MRGFVSFAFGIAILAGSLAFDAAPASAEVRFGRNVRIGGHDFSNQTFNSKRRLNVTVYNGRPRHAGCHWVRDGFGGRTKVCHLQRR
jgi:hypothetical protein